MLQICSKNLLLSVIVAGREIPDPDNGMWKHLVRLFELDAIVDHRHWCQLAKEIEPTFCDHEFDAVLKDMCGDLRGDPAAMLSIVLGGVDRFRRRHTH